MTPRPATRPAGTRRRRLNLVAVLGTASIALLSGVASLATATTFPWQHDECIQSQPQSGPLSPPQPPPVDFPAPPVDPAPPVPSTAS